MNEVFEFLVFITVGTVLLVTLAFGPVLVIDSKSCSTYSELTGRNVKFEVFGGCFVEHGDRYIPKDEYKYVEIKNDR